MRTAPTKMPLLATAAAVLLAVGAIGVAGCGANGRSDGIGVHTGDDPSTTTPGTTTPGSADPGVPTTIAPGDQPAFAADQVVWQVDTGGGFVPYAVALTDLPELTIYGDGRAFVPSDIDGDTYRLGHAYGMQLGQVSASGLAALVRDAHQSGLLGDDVDFGSPNAVDLPSTVVRLASGDKVVESTVYALGTEDGTGGNGGRRGVDAGQAARRTELQALIDHSIKLVTNRHAWVPDRLQVQQLGNLGTIDNGGGALTLWPARPFAGLL